MNTFLIAYDICDRKRLYKVAQLVYAHALGGQKSVLEAPMSKSELNSFISKLLDLTKKEDKINIIPIQSNPLLFGKASFVTYDKGVIIV